MKTHVQDDGTILYMTDKGSPVASYEPEADRLFVFARRLRGEQVDKFIQIMEDVEQKRIANGHAAYEKQLQERGADVSRALRQDDNQTPVMDVLNERPEEK